VPFLSTNTGDDNTSAFVRDIDSKRRLNGHDWPCEHAPLSVYERAVTAADVDLRPDGTGSVAQVWGTEKEKATQAWAEARAMSRCRQVSPRTSICAK
jgi:hypothetical protein